MNKRIEQIAIQAFFDEETNQPGQKMYTFGEEKMQKFAQLIVKECIDCARGAALRDDVALKNGLGFNDGISEVLVNIQKHFGVE